MTQENYIKALENCISQMIKPLNGIPFNLIIKSITGMEVEFFDEKNQSHINALKVLKEVGFEMIGKKIKSKRVNEVGNKIEPIVKDLFKAKNIKADIPENNKKRKQSAGYPDIEFTLEEKSYYLECKTFNKANINDSFRTFYLSPSENFKVTKKAVHFLISFEIVKFENEFEVKNFKIVSLNSMLCDLKSEFNASNKALYSGTKGAVVLFESK